MTLLEMFKQIPDKRRKEGKRYQLEYVLLLSVFAVLSGATGYVSMARWMKAKENEIKKIFNLNWKNMPSKSRLQVIFSSLDIDELEKVFRKFSSQLLERDKNQLTNDEAITRLNISIDGKALRGSYDNGNGEPALNLISVFAVDSRLILAHVDIRDKQSEMVNAREIIDELGLKDANITMDALHTQKNFSDGQVG